MRVGLIIDSACDLPYGFIRDNGLFILPVTARIDNQTFVDDHDPVKTEAFYQSGLLDRGHEADTEAFNVEQIYTLFMKDIVTQYDVAICETVTRSRSQIYENAAAAMQRVMADYRAPAGPQETMTCSRCGWWTAPVSLPVRACWQPIPCA